MNYRILFAGILIGAVAQSANATAASSTADAVIVSEATGGMLKATKGKYFEPTCNESVEYDAEVIDLNGDGQPEVFTLLHGTCLGGMAGENVNLYIKDKSGKWAPQFGFPGVYEILKTKNKGFPDIEIGGPGFCFPVWRWNGQVYDIYKKCPV